ncbi:hypothetical protein CXK86_07455 [Paenibacillus sp. BGI2013]|uniref:hypothetical protein n=1 Tax=Paenibacillus TaxID=44249 RepID=UPI00096EA8F0|nr:MULTISPECIES: hypothetical protein [Paenibacillus]OMF45200.1 hypothetical protein BK136_08760 [Paenibacillus amylolyticus]PKQ91160.1 hypothetical protein CXK86_07455 [Paenibacillus sp. BGI2013]
MEKNKHKVDWCDACNQGWIEVKRNSLSHNIHFRCSECLNEYKNYEDINTKKVLKIEVDWHAIDLSVEEILQNNLWRYIIKEWENGQLVRNDGVIIKVWSKEKRKFIKT